MPKFVLSLQPSPAYRRRYLLTMNALYSKTLKSTTFLLLDARAVSRFNPTHTITVPRSYSMEKLTDVLAMGGYAAYVWPSFIIAALLMLGMVITSMRSLRKAQRTLSQLQESASATSHNEA